MACVNAHVGEIALELELSLCPNSEVFLSLPIVMSRNGARAHYVLFFITWHMFLKVEGTWVSEQQL